MLLFWFLSNPRPTCRYLAGPAKDWIEGWKKKNAGWVEIKSLKAVPAAPSSCVNIKLGPLVIKLDGKSKIKTGAHEVGERLKLTQVGTIKDLIKVNLRETVVLVWHENIRLLDDDSFFMA